MAASADQIILLRRMVAEPTETPYGDASLAACIERYALLDERGGAPHTWDAATTPPTRTVNPAWIPTYDLAAAAADVWGEKASALVGSYDFDADGGSYKRSQGFLHASERERYYRARRSPTTSTLVKWPKETNASTMPWIGNLPEPA